MNEKQILNIRDVNDECAKTEILAFIKEHPGTDAAEIHSALELDFDQVFRICEELVNSGIAEYIQ